MARARGRWRVWLIRAVLALFVLSVLPVVLLRWLDPPTSAFMLARRWEAAMHDEQRDFVLRYRFVGADEISPEWPIALVAAEDQKFPQHHGFDVQAIREAIDEAENGNGSRGASTISQQVAKNLFLWSGRSWLRKGMEAYYTVLIETLWPKARIIEVYANIAEFGDGIYGAEAAAQYFFRKPASRLDARESALLAAVLPNPRRWRVNAPTAYLLRRQNWIQRQVRQLGGPAYLAGSD